MVDEHTCASLLDITDKSITSEKVIDHVEKIIAQRGAPLVLRCDNGPEFISQAPNKFADGKLGIHYISPGQPPGATDSSNPSTTGCVMNADRVTGSFQWTGIHFNPEPILVANFSQWRNIHFALAFYSKLDRPLPMGSVHRSKNASSL